MAQLSDDCFAFGDMLMPLAEAQALLRARLPVTAAVERLPLEDCLGRTLREDVIAPIPVPPHDNSAVDGYALRHAELTKGETSRLRVAERLAAGGRPPLITEPGTAVRIFTGAVMPPGFDTVLMQEDASLEGSAVAVPPGLKPGANRRKAGEDIALGSRVLAAGRRLRPWDLGLAASLGTVSLAVSKPLRVAVFSTGDELTDATPERQEGQVFDANRVVLAALLAKLGCQLSDLGILRDDLPATARALAAAAEEHDVIMTSGGVSEGEEDHVKAAIGQAGGQLHFWRVAIKPGRPVSLGTIGQAAVIGLPGNPVAAVVTFAALARPLLLSLLGNEAEEPPLLAARAAFAHRKKQGRLEWLRVSLSEPEPGSDGVPRAHLFPREGAGILSSLHGSQAFALIEEEKRGIEEGDILRCLAFSEVLS